MKVLIYKYIQAVQISQIKMMFSLPYTFCLHFYLNRIRVIDYSDYLPTSQRVRMIEVRLFIDTFIKQLGYCAPSHWSIRVF